jgi:hypothetical protein
VQDQECTVAWTRARGRLPLAETAWLEARETGRDAAFQAPVAQATGGEGVAARCVGRGEARPRGARAEDGRGLPCVGRTGRRRGRRAGQGRGSVARHTGRRWGRRTGRPRVGRGHQALGAQATDREAWPPGARQGRGTEKT